jgi:hypothetical protein
MKELFTQRREGAKGANTLTHESFIEHAIGDAFNATLDQVIAEIDEKAESFVHQPQTSQNLFAVDWIECGNRFYFHDHTVVDDEVGAEAFIEHDTIPGNWNRDPSLDGVAVFAQFMRERNFVYNFEDSGPEPRMQPVGSVNDPSSNFIFFHAKEPAAQDPAGEAKNLSAFASLREISAGSLGL